MANKNLFVLIATDYWAVMGLQAWAITDESEGNLAENRFTQSLSFSFENLDLSFNNFTGDLPTSCQIFDKPHRFLQNNQFTGSVIFLANLSLSTLNIEDNHFSGVPEHFQTIRNLRIGGNKFHTGPNYPPWKFPSNTNPTEKNISSPPLTNLSKPSFSNNRSSQKEDITCSINSSTDRWSNYDCNISNSCHYISQTVGQ
ncbi:hypothetical protein CASFOL_035166 [Castilleja foliolosa]|uniref:Uncharacterized protein n=1 Tax=Castilleja foliolosa TaxID=1961234 RepID=A0ABD3BST2_9LAMI